jgi:hypothetical protein
VGVPPGDGFVVGELELDEPCELGFGDGEVVIDAGALVIGEIDGTGEGWPVGACVGCTGGMTG